MVRRLIPLVLAVAVGATPVAREVCLVFCSEHQATSTSSPHVHQAFHHSMAGHDMPAHDLDVMGASSAACTHRDDLQAAATAVAKLALDVPFIQPGVAGAAGLSAGVSALISLSSLPPPVPLSLRVPLRV